MEPDAGLNNFATRPEVLEEGAFREGDSTCNVEPYNPPSVNVTFPPFDEAMANVYRYRQQQAVNLGSW